MNPYFKENHPLLIFGSGIFSLFLSSIVSSNFFKALFSWGIIAQAVVFLICVITAGAQVGLFLTRGTLVQLLTRGYSKKMVLRELTVFYRKIFAAIAIPNIIFSLVDLLSMKHALDIMTIISTLILLMVYILSVQVFLNTVLNNINNSEKNRSTPSAIISLIIYFSVMLFGEFLKQNNLMNLFFILILSVVLLFILNNLFRTGPKARSSFLNDDIA
ncbi:hypothetical protein G7059_09445 [Erysipelothrix sp. HDW6A]|uniref:hypothetical protein n=1 Tax=Erysipelothrix sp. HDW6A TaxID=2714928 RepID=UPI0014087978|nr:hypothetical protein [Erysipelothrix sp. HDW6A]QIK58053.1 hypothetical protein G7059_09445 [Erysipelothrix sp. HDW6A]